MNPKQEVTDHWTDRALCKGLGHLFFAHKGDWKASQRAREICDQCPVAWDCLNFALQNDERYGVWGGVGYTQRRKMTIPQRLRGPVVCGTRSGYIQGCRCAECRASQTAYAAEWRARRKHGRNR